MNVDVDRHTCCQTWNLKGVVYRLPSSLKGSFSGSMSIEGRVPWFRLSQEIVFVLWYIPGSEYDYKKLLVFPLFQLLALGILMFQLLLGCILGHQLGNVPTMQRGH